tara:strand:+ start:616 stop:1164 length:549 start_codon:yes stop_codon:yes gene_type:complete
MKKLLKESDVRRMMKFANIGTLSESFLDRLEEEEVEEAMYGNRDEEGMGEEMDADPDMDAAPDMDDAPDMGDADAGDDVDPAVAKATEAVVAAVIDALDAVPGAPPVSMEKDADDAEPMDMKGDDPDPMDEESLEEEEIDEVTSALDEAEIELEEDALSENEEFVNEVARRVAKRILESRKK